MTGLSSSRLYKEIRFFMIGKVQSRKIKWWQSWYNSKYSNIRILVWKAKNTSMIVYKFNTFPTGPDSANLVIRMYKAVDLSSLLLVRFMF